MYISYVTYALVLLLLLWGGKLARGKGTFHEDSTSLEVTKALRGFAALGVILHHISQEHAFQVSAGQGHHGELSIFVNAGFFFVAIFFFCSGFGLIKSLDTKENYLEGFLKKRVLKAILIPFYVNAVLFAIFGLAGGYDLPPLRLIAGLLGLTLLNYYAWYPVVLTLLYIAFYFIFKYVKNRKVCFALMFAVIFLQGVFFCFNGHFAWWAGEPNWWVVPGALQNAVWWKQSGVIWFFGEWWVNSSIAFFIGMVFAANEEKIRNWFKKLYLLKLLCCIALFVAFHMLAGFLQWKFGYWSEWAGKGPGILNKFISYLGQLPQVSMFVIMLFAIMLVYHVQNPVLKFMGNISYETYMMNLVAITVFRFLIYNGRSPLYKAGNYNLALYEVCVLASTIVLALLFKLLNKLVYKLFKL
ncbi:MAG: acyltransferase family protein [Spirochaetaceae bacterium]|nr:acyltransferase family protein [Spirochaetaceae bacterium]